MMQFFVKKTDLIEQAAMEKRGRQAYEIGVIKQYVVIKRYRFGLVDAASFFVDDMIIAIGEIGIRTPIECIDGRLDGMWQIRIIGIKTGNNASRRHLNSYINASYAADIPEGKPAQPVSVTFQDGERLVAGTPVDDNEFNVRAILAKYAFDGRTQKAILVVGGHHDGYPWKSEVNCHQERLE